MSRLPVLMYHNVSNNLDNEKGLTISNAKLETHFKYLVAEGYTTCFFSEIDHCFNTKRKNVIITFDDVTENQLLYAYPLLKKYNLKATFFIPFHFVGKTDDWNSGKEKIMSVVQLQSLDSTIVELGHHSYEHLKYHQIPIASIENDLNKSFEFIESNNLSVVNTIAYPYGKFPRDKSKNKAFKNLLLKKGFSYGLRIGNRVNKFPFKDVFEINRIDIKGEYSLNRFKFKLKYGKTGLF